MTGGTRVMSGLISVQVTANPGETFLDRMIALVEGAERQKTPNEIALNILLAGLTIVFLIAVVTLQPFAIYSGAPQSIFVLISLLVCLIPTTIGGLLSAIGIAGMDRLVQHNARDVGTRGRSRRRRSHVPRQDRNDHARQSPGDRFRIAQASATRCSPTRRSWHLCPTRRPKDAPSSCSRKSGGALRGRELSAAGDVRPLHGPDSHVGCQPVRDAPRACRCRWRALPSAMPTCAIRKGAADAIRGG